MPQDPRSYRAFWPVYLRAHSRPGTQRLHLVATLAGMVVAVVGLFQGVWWSIPAAIMVAYGISIPSHLIVEGNLPTAGCHPLWSAVADVQLCALLVMGRLGAEMRRHGVAVAEPRGRGRVQTAC
jgi:hypothetical protein